MGLTYEDRVYRLSYRACRGEAPRTRKQSKAKTDWREPGRTLDREVHIMEDSATTLDFDPCTCGCGSMSHIGDDDIADRLEDEHMESGATSYEQRHSIELCNGCTDTVCCDEDSGWIAGEAYCGSCFQAWKTAGGENA